MISVDIPFPAIELPSVWTWLEESKLSLLTDQGSHNAAEFVQNWVDRKAITWGVYRDGELGGWVAWEPLTGNAHCVFRRLFWGRDTTVPAINLVAGMIFAEGIERIGMMVREDNHLVQRLIGEIGGLKEALWYRQPDGTVITDKGQPINMIQFGLYRERWYAKQAEQDRVDVGASVRGGGDTRLAESAS